MTGLPVVMLTEYRRAESIKSNFLKQSFDYLDRCNHDLVIYTLLESRFLSDNILKR